MGAGFGAIGGAGSAKPGEALEGAEHGAIMGAGTALAMQGAGKLASTVYNKAIDPMVGWVARAFGVQDPAKWTERKMVETLLSEVLTPEAD
jgi:hypothetical protein